MTAPKMMFASSPTASCTSEVASLTSCSVMLGPPVMLTSTPRAPEISTSSSSGLEMACFVASAARSGPSAIPVPMRASPMFAMIVLTSAKSRLTRPGTVMRSLMPRVACSSTSSAIEKAVVNGVSVPTMRSSFSLGMMISVSTASLRALSPSLADALRRLPSNMNGRVTTPTVSAPISRAMRATSGAAPVPVPPPIPAVTKTMSEPLTASTTRPSSSSTA